MPEGVVKSKIITGTAIVLPGEIKSSDIISVTCKGFFEKDICRDFCFDNLDPSLKNRIAKGDIIVTGRRFARGESGEESVLALMGLGISALIAVSVDRIFLRNSINLGLPVVVFPLALEMIEDGDNIEVDPFESFVRNLTKGLAARGKMLPHILRRILEAGGIVNDVIAGLEKKK